MQRTLCVCIIVFSLFPCPDLINCLGTKDDTTILANVLNFTGGLLHEAFQLLAPPKTAQPGPIDCTDVQKAGNTKSGIYRIWPMNWKSYGSFEVYCDMETDGGGWTVIQRRGDFKQPKDYFYKTWKEYQRGFGKLDEDFWLGNDKIFSLTNQGNYSIRFGLKDNGEKRFAVYQEFWIENEKQLYTAHVSGFSGDAGDSFSRVNGMKFSTKDNDNDMWQKNCAETYKGAWWYKGCQFPNLNGLYLSDSGNSFGVGVGWATWKGLYYSLAEVDMMIRRVQDSILFYKINVINSDTNIAV